MVAKSQRSLLGVVVVAACSWVSGATYFVSADGDSNAATGSIAAPFRTIRKAADRIVAGDTCMIRQGIYRETLVPKASGSAGRPVVFMSYQGENVFISAADPVTGWTRDAGGVWKAPCSWNLGLGRNQVFVNGEGMYEARYPNIDHPEPTGRDNFSGEKFVRAGPVDHVAPGEVNAAFIGGFTEGSQENPGGLAGIGKIFVGRDAASSGRDNLPRFLDSCRAANAPQDFLAGALVHKISGWTAEYGLVTSGWGVESGGEDAGWMYLNVQRDNWYFGGYSVFAIIGKRCLLDAPEEWILEGGTLYLRPPQDKDPATLLVEAKRRRLVVDAEGVSYIELRGLHLLGGSVRLAGCSNWVIEGCHARYTAHATNYLHNQNSGGTIDYSTGEWGWYVNGDNNVIRGSSVAFSSHVGIFLLGDGNLVTECLVHDCDYSGASTVGIAIGTDQQQGHNTVSHTTVHTTGKSAFSFSQTQPFTLATSQKFTYIHAYNTMCLTEDGGTFYIWGASGSGTEISYCWMHDMMQWWNTHHVYMDYGGWSNIVHHNVFWQEYGNAENNAMTVDPQSNIVYNNTAIDSVRSDIYKGFDEQGINALWAKNDPSGWGIKDATNRDFSLVAGSKAIDKGTVTIDSVYDKDLLPRPYPFPDSERVGQPDLGAYEYGKPRWVPGHTWGEVVWSYPPSAGSTTGRDAAVVRHRPNPRCVALGDHVRVTVPGARGFEARVMDLAGRVVVDRRAKAGEGIRIPIATLPSSVLLVRVSVVGGGTATFRVSTAR